MKTLKEAYKDALEKKVAIGHFNISDSTQLNAIAQAAKDLNVPVIIGVSEGERDFVGLKKAVAVVRAAREEYDIEIFINADHMHSVQGCIDAIDAGFDSVIFDGTKMSAEENKEGAKEVVAYAKERGVIVEAEVGYIGTSSKLLDEVPDDVVFDSLPTADEVLSFVKETGIDAVAPAVGNLHGMLKGRANPSLHIDRIREIRTALGNEVGMVLHGGSGLTDSDFSHAIEAGINVVHINTEIRVAYRKGIEASLEAKPEEVAPYRYLNGGYDGVYKTVRKRLQLFNKIS